MAAPHWNDRTTTGRHAPVCQVFVLPQVQGPARVRWQVAAQATWHPEKARKSHLRLYESQKGAFDEFAHNFA